MWQQIIQHFQTLEERPIERMAFLVGGLVFFWMIESAIPLLELNYRKTKIKHAAVNFSFTAMHLIIHTFIAVIIVLLSDWCRAAGFGIVHWTNAGILGAILISFLVLDFFGGWLVHITEHKLPLLWRFHLVHHADNNVDVTTGLRHHPIESVIRGVFFLAAIVVSGAPIYAVMIYQTFLILYTAFTHANIRLPEKIDTFLSYVLISPNMHKVHHHWQQPYTDTNYGAVLSIWDRMFGTYTTLHHTKIKYGLDKHYPNEEDENFMLLLKRPFKKQIEDL